MSELQSNIDILKTLTTLLEEKDKDIILREKYLSTLVAIQQILLISVIDKNIYEIILDLLGGISDSDIILIFNNKIDKDSKEMMAIPLTHWEKQPGSIYVKEIFEKTISVNKHPLLTDILKNNNTFQITTNKIYDKDFFINFGAKATMILPILVSNYMATNTYYGFFVFLNYKNEIQWTKAQVDLIKNVVSSISLALERQISYDSLKLFEGALEVINNPIIITDKDGIIIWINKAFTDLTGFYPSETIGKTPRIIKSNKHNKAFYEEIWKTITNGETWRGKIINKYKNEKIQEEEMSITPIRDSSNKIAYYVGVKNIKI